VSSQRIAVAATGLQSLQAGLSVADQGGNAVDAALAAAMVALATEPGMVSFGGGAYVSVWPVDREPVVVDGNVEMPGRGLPADRFGTGVRDVHSAYGGGITMQAGPGSVATPGIIPAFGVVHDAHARLDWSRLVSPAAAAARAYPMSPAAARYLALVADDLFGVDEEARALVHRADGGHLAPGEAASNPALAAVLEQLAADGPSLFTSGDVGRSLVADMAASGGLVTADDLAAYAPVTRPATLLDVGDWRIATNPPPAIGGPLLAVMLGELARRSPWTWADAIAIQRSVLEYRLGVHNHENDLEQAGRDLLAAVARDGLAALRGSASTAHVSAVDADGTACAITMSSGYGSGTCIPGTGILLNNALGEVELNPGGLHSADPGTRLASNMAPTTGRTGDGRVLAIGSPGADRITTALMLVLGQGCLHDAELHTAVADPRLHVRRLHDGGYVVEHEADDEIRAAVAASGLPGHEYPEPHMYFGGVGAAYRFADGRLDASGDSRREAAVGVV